MSSAYFTIGQLLDAFLQSSEYKLKMTGDLRQPVGVPVLVINVLDISFQRGTLKSYLKNCRSTTE